MDGETPRSVHTANLPELLRGLGSSLAVSTYQTGHVVLVRADGDTCNTHFRAAHKPMGIAYGSAGLAVGCERSVRFWRNAPGAAAAIEPRGSHDACFVPRTEHVTGAIDAHELGWAAHDELWVVNTRFSCLATLDYEHSFRPRWRPPFVTAFAPEDRCHLNGLEIIDGRPRFVTALAATDRAEGWREQKARGGVVIDVERDEVRLEGLSMPHSPRWHEGALWLLESGEGGLVRADLEAGTWETVSRLPGFARGLAFVGPLAFVGLSKVRETAVFGDVPIVERREERTCGLWVVDVRSGETVAFLRFEAGVEEIFSVALLPGLGYPELLDFGDPRTAQTFVLPDEALELVPPTLLAGPAIGAPPATRATGASLGPEFQAAYRRGLVARDTGAWAAARSAFGDCLRLVPGQPDVLNDLGAVAYQLDELDEACRLFESAVAGRPELAMAHLNLGLARLKMGEYETGWPEFEWRWRTEAFTPLECPQPQWDGSDLGDRTLLVHTEQGAGDVFQFARYLPAAAARCGRLLLVAPEELHALLAGIEGVDEIRAAGRLEANAFDAYSPLMSLPRCVGVEAPEPPIPEIYLRVPDGVAAPSSLAANDRSMTVGLAWAGSPSHGDDRHRSIDLELLSPVLGVPGVEFVGLQLGERRGQASRLPVPLEVRDLGEGIVGWDRTAAVVAELDLVIAVDTAIAHLAGGLGRPVWVLLSAGSDWRWGRSGRRTPWYPTMRLFRQVRHLDWGPVAREVAAALRERAAARQ